MSFIKSMVSGFCLVICLSSCSPDNDSLETVFEAKKGHYTLNTRHLNEQQQPLFINQLIRQNSLYLLQHANNPVDWSAWGEEAFAKAKELNKPIFLSIGYSTCHWCHVMARESFESIDIANYINEHFIPIKVDREEHPDVDELYLTSVQMLTGKAGWPLTAVLTPDGHAFFGGTYFSPEELLNVLKKVSDTWVHRQDAVLEQANRLTKALKEMRQSSEKIKTISAAFTAEAATRIEGELQPNVNSNGAQTKPGFPREPEMLFLLNYAQRQLSQSTIDVVTQRLLRLAAGGIHDQIGGGFHRYTVDSEWRIPHFEKMLYNQAQMAQAYFRAFQLTGNQHLKVLGRQTLEFLLRELQAPEGGFYSAMDAESEGPNGIKAEGEFYVWTQDQLASVLSESEHLIANNILGVSVQGNFNGRNVLQNKSFSPDYSTEAAFYNKDTKLILRKLADVRGLRKSPQVDTKIITAWNGMAISSLATAYGADGEPQYLNAALKASKRIWSASFSQKKGLARTIPMGRNRVQGTLEDYAYFANALIDVFDVSGDQLWLERATQITKQMINRFHDSETGGFQISGSALNSVSNIKLVTARDDAVFSGNSMAAQVLARMLRRTGELHYKQLSLEVISAFSKQLLANPESLSGMLLAADFLNNGDVGTTQYAAKGKVTVNTSSENGVLSIKVDIADGWHINASRVLNEYLIPTSISPSQGSCTNIEAVDYPKGKLVSLGFQEDELLVYDRSVILLVRTVDSDHCPVVAAELSIQACTDEVCQSPEKIQIRSIASTKP